MKAADFVEQLERLTGTPVKELAETETGLLESILSNLAEDSRALGWTQFNELLLIANKDRVTPSFFSFFFGAACPLNCVADGVDKFRRLALLCFGNFVYAFRVLSVCQTDEVLRDKLDIWRPIDEAEAKLRFTQRQRRIAHIDLIERSDTWLLGYLSAREVVAECGRIELLKDLVLAADSWASLREAVRAKANPKEVATLEIAITELQKQTNDEYNKIATVLQTAERPLVARRSHMKKIRDRGARNQEVYLTWDHMDVYFATSMRKRWEFEELHTFITALLAESALEDIRDHLRYFDPTQAYTESRVAKGLVEALMLKRARVTIYSVQDTDTLGKDSELAATLAQGKPVIAYVPCLDVSARSAELKRQPVVLLERARFVLFADDDLPAAQKRILARFVERSAETLERAAWLQPTDSEVDPAASDVSSIVADAEARIYNKRAETLRAFHPLGLQVHLETGVANGVLVVRNSKECAELLRGVLLNQLEFEIEEDAKERVWYLRERISRSVFRVVSRDRKLTNSFWNFYRTGSDVNPGKSGSRVSAQLSRGTLPPNLDAR